MSSPQDDECPSEACVGGEESSLAVGASGLFLTCPHVSRISCDSDGHACCVELGVVECRGEELKEQQPLWPQEILEWPAGVGCGRGKGHSLERDLE